MHSPFTNVEIFSKAQRKISGLALSALFSVAGKEKQT